MGLLLNSLEEQETSLQMAEDSTAKAAEEAGAVHSLESLMVWGEVLELYALDWDETFANAPCISPRNTGTCLCALLSRRSRAIRLP